ncbi:MULTISPECIES: MerR family transcriptional regulator [Actinoplanes]|uniref:MerR family transcriptional regulator n=1 Tax=Actinoplanes TaxID=1865 RepID=UPI0005F2CDAE|nr:MULTISPECIES: MerR family transcriptional regulator [Actinoplanes]GLY00997.1 putative thiol-specific antioxidant related protein/Peroxidoxin BcpB [Actinoplanes sp. NBRC 101535]
MRVGELARRTGTTVRALRYYESAGLVVPRRLTNGYREYDPVAIRLVQQIRELTTLGLSVEETRPFVESLAEGREADVCAAAVATYRSAIDALHQRIGRLTAQRDGLHERLDSAAGRIPPPPPGRASADPASLVGVRVPSLEFYATDGRPIDLGDLGPGRSVVFVYPLTGRPGVDLPDSLLHIPGARGSTEQASWFRDHHAELLTAGAARVFGLSAQSTGYQRELVHRLRLPYPLLPDPRMTLAAALGLPTIGGADMVLYRRITLIIQNGTVEHVFHPIAEPAMHALEVMRWLAQHRPARTASA